MANVDACNILETRLRDRGQLAQQKADKEKIAASQAAINSIRLSSGSNWLEEYLDWLGVVFEVDKEHDMMKMLKEREGTLNRQWTAEHDKGMNSCYKMPTLISYQDLY